MNPWVIHSRGEHQMSTNPTNSHGNYLKNEKTSVQTVRNFLQKRTIHKLLGYFSEDWLQNLIMLEVPEVQNGKM